MAQASAFDVASLVVNAFVAFGTLSAAAIALWLGLAGMSETAARMNRLERAERRQVTLKVSQTNDHRPLTDKAIVEVINDSSGLILNVSVELSMNVDQPGGFQWGERPQPTHVAARSSETGTGIFYFGVRDGESKALGDRTITLPKPEEIRWSLGWQDADGRWWGRADGGEPVVMYGPLGEKEIAVSAPPTRRARVLKRLRLYPWPGSIR
jgi:hypothetical protein